MDNLGLRCFFEVVSSGNLAIAAQRLYLSTSTVSYQIRHLEQEIGFNLFYRDGKHLRLTPSGKYYYDHVKVIFEQYLNIVDSAKSLNNQQRFNVGFTTDLLMEYYPKLAQKFSKKYPSVYLNAIPVGYHDGIRPLQTYSVDMMFTYECRVVNNKEYEYDAVRNENFVVGLSLNHPLANRTMLTLDDINQQTIYYCKNDYTWINHFINHLGSKYQFKSKQVDYDVLVLSNVKQNNGIALFPFAQWNNDSNGIVFIPLNSDIQISKVLAWKLNHTCQYFDSFKKIVKSTIVC